MTLLLRLRGNSEVELAALKRRRVIDDTTYGVPARRNGTVGVARHPEDRRPLGEHLAQPGPVIERPREGKAAKKARGGRLGREIRAGEPDVRGAG